MDNSNQASARGNIQELNDDILLRIFDYLHYDDKIRLRRTCYRWKALLDLQLSRLRAIRLGHFQRGGFNTTSGLELACEQHQTPTHRQQTGTLFNENILQFPADLETQCFSVDRFDFLHRSLRLTHNQITTLSLGRLNITYRLLTVIAHNLPNLEHLELISCASEGPNSTNSMKKRKSPFEDHNNTTDSAKSFENANLPSLESFNSEREQANMESIYSRLLYNQHRDEQVNISERLQRAEMVKSCALVRESKSRQYWPKLRHLLVKECNLLNEFSVSLILAIACQTLEHLAVESNQYLTGEFLNYCGPHLKVLRVKYCPLLQLKFLEDLIKLKQLLAPIDDNLSQQTADKQPLTRNHSKVSSNPQPISPSLFQKIRDNNHHRRDIYCML